MDKPNPACLFDSLMAIDASQSYQHFGDDHDLDANLLMDAEKSPLIPEMGERHAL